MTYWLNYQMEGGILAVLTPTNKCEGLFLRAGICFVVIVEERVGRVVGDILPLLSYSFQDPNTIFLRTPGRLFFFYPIEGKAD